MKEKHDIIFRLPVYWGTPVLFPVIPRGKSLPVWEWIPRAVPSPQFWPIPSCPIGIFYSGSLYIWHCRLCNSVQSVRYRYLRINAMKEKRTTASNSYCTWLIYNMLNVNISFNIYDNNNYVKSKTSFKYSKDCLKVFIKMHTSL